jgi:sugar (pentulose or hexulose) kinase
VKQLEGTTKHPLILAAGFSDERVETAIYDANLAMIEAAGIRRPPPAGQARLVPPPEDELSSLLELFLGCLRELRERNPRAFEGLDALALTGDAGPAVAADGEGSPPAGGPRGGARLPPSAPLFLSLKDYIFHSLTGTHATDSTTASSSGLFDVRTGRWHRGRLKALGIGESRLPGVPRGDRRRGAPGPLNAPVLLKRGLFFTKPLPVMNDTNTLSALHVGAGAAETGDLLISLGGPECVSYLVDAVGDRPCAYLLRFQGDGYHATAAPRGAGEYLRWGSGIFSPVHSRGKSFACEGEPARGSTGGDAVVFCPFAGTEAGGSREPPGGAILGLTLDTAGKDILRGIVEGSAFDLFQAVRETGGDAASRVFLCADLPSGGDLASVLAHIMNKDIRLVRRERCTPLAGCALNALRNLGAPPPSTRSPRTGSSAEGPEPEVETTLRPDPESRDRLLGMLRSVSSLRRMSGI